MPKKLLSVFAVLVVALVGVSLVAAQSGKLPGSGWKSGQTIQNIGAGNASIVFEAYDSTGLSYACGTKGAAPGASVNFLTDSDCTTVPAGFVGSAVVSADQPIAAVVNVNNRGVGMASGQYRGTDGADVATSIAFPLVKNAFNGRTTTFYVQNAGSAANTMTATFKANGTTYTKVYSNVPVNAMAVVSPADAGVPAGVFGSLSVTGTQPLAGSSLEHESSAAVAQNLQASSAFTPNDYDTKAFCSLVRNAHTVRRQTTGVQAQNVASVAQTITIDYSYAVGNGPLQTKSYTSPSVAPGESFNFHSAGDINTFGLPAGALGSATVTGNGGNIAVSVNDRSIGQSPADRFTTYACAPGNSATNTVVLPQYKEFFGGNTTGVQIQNVGSADATIQVTYQATGSGATVTFTAPAVKPGANAVFHGVSTLSSPAGISVVSGNPASLNNTFGGVTITSNQPIVATANESSTAPNASGQDTKNYEGINQ